MKLIAMLGAGAMVAGSMVATTAPASAQRYDGWRGGYDQRYDGGRRDWRDGRGWRDDRGRGWNGNRGWHRGWDRPRTRVVCRWERTWHGRERVCFRTYR